MSHRRTAPGAGALALARLAADDDVEAGRPLDAGERLLEIGDDVLQRSITQSPLDAQDALLPLARDRAGSRARADGALLEPLVAPTRTSAMPGTSRMTASTRAPSAAAVSRS